MQNELFKKIMKLKSKSTWRDSQNVSKQTKKQQNRRIQAQEIEIKDFKHAYFKL